MAPTLRNISLIVRTSFSKGYIKLSTSNPKWRFIAQRIGLDQVIFKIQQVLNWQRNHLLPLVSRIEHKLDELTLASQAVTKGTQILLTLKYQEIASRGVTLNFSDVEFRNFSQTGEDGILHYIFSLIGTENKKCVEICAGDGRECISANLILNHGWFGLLVDGDEQNVQRGQKFFTTHPDSKIIPPCFLQRWVSRESVNSIFEESGFEGDIDLLTIDMDGIDYWIWDAINVSNPRVVVVEFLANFPGKAVTVPYRTDFVGKWIPHEVLDTESDLSTSNTRIGRGGKLNKWLAYYGGASLTAFIKLARRKGYRLVGANSTGYNAFFIRNDIGTEFFPEVEESTCYNTLLQPFILTDSAVLKDYEYEEV